MNIIILADKYQKRMKSKGCVGLFEHKRKPLYVHQYEQLKKIFPKCNILYIYGFDHKRLEISIEQNKKNLKRDITFVYNQNYETFNDGASLSLVSDNLNEDTVLFMGDNVVNGSTFKKIKINESFSQVIMAQNNNYSKLGCVVVNNKVENVFFDLDNKIENLYFLKKHDCNILKNILKNTKQTNNMFTFELINKMIENNIVFKPIHKNKNTKCKIKA